MGKLIVIKGADFSNVAVARESMLNTIAYENFTFKQLFEDNNLFGISGGFESGSYSPLVVNSGNPTITNEVADSGTYSLKILGTSSQQLKANNTWAEQSFMACRVSCTRYVQGGGIGVIFGSQLVGTNATTNGFQTFTGIKNATASDNRFYIGSFSSANLDGYVDTPVAIDMSIFATAPSLETLTNLYNQYVNLKR